MSLSALRKISDEGVRFRSHIDGSELFLGPREAVRIQEALGADIIMTLDECPPADADETAVRKAVERTLRWATECRAAKSRPDQAMFAIVQGGRFPELRRFCADALVQMDFPGYAVGGVSVGEPKEELRSVISMTGPMLPAEKPRYLMGVGLPEDMVEAVAAGFDMFDCVVPTRNARNSGLFTWSGKMKIRNEKFRNDFSPVDGNCGCYLCRNFTRAYLRHLFVAGEMLGPVLATMHNLRFFMDLMERIRQSITDGTFSELRSKITRVYSV